MFCSCSNRTHVLAKLGAGKRRGWWSSNLQIETALAGLASKLIVAASAAVGEAQTSDHSIDYPATGALPIAIRPTQMAGGDPLALATIFKASATCPSLPFRRQRGPTPLRKSRQRYRQAAYRLRSISLNPTQLGLHAIFDDIIAWD
jgi:hypothetical protein